MPSVHWHLCYPKLHKRRTFDLDLIVGSLGALWGFFDRSPTHALLISFQAIAPTEHSGHYQ